MEIFRYYYVILFYNGGGNLNDELQEQLETLLAEVRLLSRSVIHLRQSDFRLVFGEQIKPILMERIERSFSGEAEAASDGPDRPRARLEDLVERYIDAFQREGAEAAARTLDEFESAPSMHSSSDQWSRRQAFISGLVGQMRDYLAASDRISEQAGLPDEAKAPPAKPRRSLSPASAERTLGPLSSSRRIEVLLLLSNDEESLAALSRTLDMKKGHLQFHLNVLNDAGYIAYDRKSHLYALTDRGHRALEGVARLVEDIEAP